MSVLELFDTLRKAGIRLSIDEGNLIISNAKNRLNATLLQEIKDKKVQIIGALSSSISPKEHELFAVEDQEYYECSHAQKRFWVMHELEENSVAYNMPHAFVLEGELNVSLLDQAFTHLLVKHESLRTIFRLVNGSPRQQVKQIINTSGVEYLDISNNDQPEIDAREITNRFAAHVFDLENGPLLKLHVVKIANKKFVLLFVIHHIICDEQSVGILIKEIVDFYEKRTLDPSFQTDGQLNIQLRDFTSWQNKKIAGNEFENGQLFWKQQFEKDLKPLNLSMSPRPPEKTSNGGSKNFLIQPDLTKLIERRCQENEVSVFMMLLTTLYTFLFRYSGQTDIVVGTPTSGRSEPILENQIGFYINTIPLRASFQPDETFSHLLQKVKSIVLNGIANQFYPFDKLLSELNIARDISRSPLFDVFINYQNDIENIDRSEFSDVRVASYNDLEMSVSKFDLTFNFTHSTKGIAILLQYNSDLFTADQAQLLVDRFLLVLSSVTDNDDILLAKVELLTAKENSLILNDFNNTEVRYPQVESLVELVERIVSKQPDRIAIAIDDRFITYEELNNRANHLAAFLRNNVKIQKEEIIAIMMNRSEWMVISILGVMKSGASYLPVDPEWPIQRQLFMLDDASPKLVLCETSTEQQAISLKHKSLCVDIEWELISDCPSHNFPLISDSKDLLYVIYTSGSTGKPKGVGVTHGAVVNFLNAIHDQPGIHESDKLLALTTFTFDISVLELFLPLVTGAVVVVANKYQILDPEQLALILKKERITLLQSTPSLLSVITSNNDSLDLTNIKVLSGGEKLTYKLAGELLPKVSSLWNMYGPTETTIWSSFKKIESIDEILSIGRPISNTRVYILDDYQSLVPLGVTGELYVGGAGLSRGYLNRPELTQEKFVSNPFMADDILYRTGDSARWLSDGTIEFQGRKDYQVKIRGYRIELSEIEDALSSHVHVEAAIVTAEEHASGEKYLLGYIVSEQSLTINELREYLNDRLPAYMIPNEFRQLDHFPLTSNGKIDRSRLRESAYGALHIGGSSYQEPVSEVEYQLVQIWEDVLNKRPIGISDNFFDLGGHSLIATKLIMRIEKDLHRKLGLRTVFTHPTISRLAGLIEANKQVLYESIRLLPFQDHYAVSHSQKRMWILHQLEENSIAYNLPGAVRLRGRLSVSSLGRAFKSLVDRHEILRTNFKMVDGELRQFIHSQDAHGFEMSYKDIQNDPDAENFIRSRIIGFTEKAFDLEKDLLLCSELVQLSADECVLLFNMHHIISDGWSMEILIKELTQLYNWHSEGKGDLLPPLSIHYKDYSSWQNIRLSEGSLMSHQSYWMSELGGELPVLDFPGDHLRPAIKSHSGKSISITIDEELTARVQQFANDNGVSLFTVLMSGVRALLYRYTGQQDMIIGTPISGRDHSDLENQIGFYVNTLAIRTQVTGKDTFETLLRHMEEKLLKAYEHQIYPFDQIIEDLQISRNPSRSPVFDVVVVMENEVKNTNKINSKLEIAPLGEGKQTNNFDLEFLFSQQDNRLRLQLRYNCDLYSSDRIVRMGEHFKAMLNALEQDITALVSQVFYLSSLETKQLLSEFNDTTSAYPSDKRVHELFEEQAISTPRKAALVFKDIILTYQTLNEKSNCLANCLSDKLTMNSNKIIGVLMDRSEKLVITLLAILKLGNTYLILDPLQPKTRMKFELEDANIKTCIVDSAYSALLPVKSSLDIIDIHYLWKNTDQYSNQNLERTGNSLDTAYAIYTSGTTGNPKGVLIPHRGIVRLVRNTNYIQLDSERLLQTGALTFDAFTFELWGMLLNGGTIFLSSKDELIDVNALKKKIHRDQISVMWFTSSWCNLLIDTDITLFEPLKKILVGGDVVSLKHIDKIQKKYPFINIINGYGPTENTTFSVCHLIDTDRLMKSIPIGRPISNTRVYILDDYQSLVPLGVTGELYVGGAGLSRGYLNRPELTQEKFVSNPFMADDILYRTGDSARWLSDGTIEFQGRKDYQVKIRGYRIELSEIEDALSSHVHVEAAIVTAEEHASGEKYLLGYIVSEQSLTINELREYLNDRLPAYMIPNEFRQLDHFPLTSNGKIDRSRLRESAYGALHIGGSSYQEPVSEVEYQLVQIWEDVLNKRPIGISDNFFDLGGHSLIATKLIMRIEKDLHRKLGLRTVFTHPTISRLAGLIEANKQVLYESIRLLPFQDHYAVSHSQKRMWILHQLEENSIAYNLPGAVRLRGRLSVSSLGRAFKSLVDRHEILRTNFKMVDGELRQFIHSQDAHGFEMSYKDIQNDPDAENFIRSRIIGFTEKAFDLEKDLLLCSELVQLSADECVLLFNMHHIISDGWSMEILIKELTQLYNWHSEGKGDLLPPLSIHYKDYSSWQNIRLSEGSLMSHQSYWMSELGGELPVLDFPGDHLRPAIKSHSGKSISITIDEELTARVQQFANDNGVSLFTVLMSGVRALLYRYTGQQDMIIGTPISGRDHSDLENQIGFYVNTLAIRTQVTGKDTFETLLRHMEEKLLKAYEHQIYPFDQIIEDLQISRNPSRSPAFDVWAVLHMNENRSGVMGNAADIQISNYSFDFTQSRYDLKFVFERLSKNISLQIEYNDDLLTTNTVNEMLNSFLKIYQSAGQNKEILIKHLDITREEHKPVIATSIFSAKMNRKTQKKS